MANIVNKSHSNFNKHFYSLSFKDAKQLSLRPHSCMTEIRHLKKISFSPKYLSDVRLGIKEVLQKELFIYSKELHGVPIAFDNIKIIDSKIIDDQEFIGLSISVLFMVFKPDVGKLLHGKVNKLGMHHYGCIIHNCINGSLRHPKRETLTEDQKKKLDEIKIDDEVLFKIFKLDIHHDILLVLGDIATSFYKSNVNYSCSPTRMSNDVTNKSNLKKSIKHEDKPSLNHLEREENNCLPKKSLNSVKNTKVNEGKRKHRNDSASDSAGVPSPLKVKKNDIVSAGKHNVVIGTEVESDDYAIANKTAIIERTPTKKKKTKKLIKVKEEDDS